MPKRSYRPLSNRLFGWGNVVSNKKKLPEQGFRQS